MSRFASAVATALLVFAGGSSAQTPSPSQPAERLCREHPKVVGQCFTVHGRMNYWNGNPSVRIWRVGTTRVLGVSEGRFQTAGYVNLPRAIEAKLSWKTDLFGDFSVCPFTSDEPGVMQLVCVNSAEHLDVRPRARQ